MKSRETRWASAVVLAATCSVVAVAGVDFQMAGTGSADDPPIALPGDSPEATEAELTGLAGDLRGEEILSYAQEPAGGWPVALVPVATFLQLDEVQVGDAVDLLIARREAVAPLVPEIVSRERALRETLASDDPSPAAIGVLVLQLRALHAQVAAIQAGFVVQFFQLLDVEQQQRFEVIQVAARLQPLLPAFGALGLILRP